MHQSQFAEQISEHEKVRTDLHFITEREKKSQLCAVVLLESCKFYSRSNICNSSLDRKIILKNPGTLFELETSGEFTFFPYLHSQLRNLPELLVLCLSRSHQTFSVVVESLVQAHTEDHSRSASCGGWCNLPDCSYPLALGSAPFCLIWANEETFYRLYSSISSA